MGQDVRQDWAIPLPVMHALMERLEEEWGMGGNLEDRALIASIGAYAIIAFCGSFRGSEVFLTDLCGLRKYLWEPLSPEAPPHVVIPLLGQFKGEALKERLQSIQVNQVGLIPGDVDILEDFGVS